MLRAYSKDIQVDANTPIPFNTDKFDVGPNVSHTAGNSNITVNRPGFYEVDLDISFTTQETVTDPVTIQLFANGVAIPDAIIETSVTSNTTIRNCSFNTIIRALPGVPYQNVTLTVIPNTAITISSVAIGIDQ